MHIDFASSSNGTYNNAGSSRQLANYLEHEDLERMEKGIYAEGFFDLTDDNIYKSKVIKDIDCLLFIFASSDFTDSGASAGLICALSIYPNANFTTSLFFSE